MGNINLTTKASPKVVERFKKVSCTEGLYTAAYDWTGVATVRVYSVDNLPLQTYDRTKTSGSRFGTLSELGDTIQEMTVTDEPSFNGTIDKANNESQMQIKAAAKVLRRQLDEVIVPYVDKYRLGKMAAGAGQKRWGYTMNKSTIVEEIMSANAQMSNQLVPEDGRVIYITYSNYVKLKLADQVIGADNLATEAVVNGERGIIDGLHVRVIPDTYMPTVTVKEGTTAVPNFIIVHKGSAVAPKKIETFRVITEDKDIDGSIVQGHLLHDCFVLTTLADGILADYSISDPG